ncbi:MAG: hypothetical protein Aurels2KO_42080 [Aureliella sp.]
MSRPDQPGANMPRPNSNHNPLGLRVVHADDFAQSPDLPDMDPTDAELKAIESGQPFELDHDTEQSPIAGRIGDPLAAAGEPSRVCVGAGEVFELLQDAITTNRAWLNDFRDDTIEIPQDMYEILVAYRKFVYRKAA